MKNLYLLLLLCSACALQTSECPEGYMVQKQTMVTPSGVVTQPNEYGQLPPGTLRVGENICIRKQGVIEPRPAFTTQGTAMGTGPSTDFFGAWKIWPLADNKILTLAGTELAGTPGQDFLVSYSDGTSAYLAGNGGPTATPGKTQITRNRDRTILVTESNAPRVIADSDIGSTAGSDVVNRKAGLAMPAYILANTSGGAGTVLPDNMYVSYRAVFRRTSGSYTFQGATSAAYTMVNSSGADCNPLLSVFWTADTTVVAGDLIEIYKVDYQDDIDLLGDRYRYAFSYTLTSSDISARTASFIDTAGATAADLYSNGEQEGSSLSNFMPPPSTDVVTFKGATFYNATQAWHLRTLRAKYLWGEMFGADGRANSIGFVEKTVTYTSGFPTITASDVTGLTVGMRIASGFPALTKINSITGSGPYTITASANATGSGAGVDLQFTDVIEIDGVTVDASSAPIFALDLAAKNIADTVDVIAMPDRPLIVDTRFVTFSLLLPVSATGPFTIRATHGDRYTPPLPEITATVETSTADARTNRLFFSKIDQPEAVGPSSSLLVGHGTILRLIATQESLFAFCTDGIYRITGDGDDWSVEPFDPDTILLTPDAVDTMDNTIFALTSAGFVEVTERGVKKISSPLIGDSIRALWKQFQSTSPAIPYTWAIQVACDKYRNEVWINFNDTDDDQSAYVATYIWNTETSTFTTQTTEQSIGIGYVPYLQSIVTATSSGTPLRLQLRKYSASTYMSASLEFNPVVGDDVGLLKQWIDTTLFFESLAGTVTVTPNFEGVDYGTPYTIAAGTNFEHVVAILQNYAYNKHCRFGIDIAGTSSWALLGLTYRFRTASETLRA